MKVVPQIVVFLVLVALGGVAYRYYQPFQRLVDDIVQVSGMMEPAAIEPADQPELSSKPEPAALPDIKSRSEVMTYAADAVPEASPRPTVQEGDITTQVARPAPATEEKQPEMPLTESQPPVSGKDATPLSEPLAPVEVMAPEQPVVEASPRGEASATQALPQPPAGMMPGQAMPPVSAMSEEPPVRSPAQPPFQPRPGMMPGQTMPPVSVMSEEPPVRSPAQPPFQPRPGMMPGQAMPPVSAMPEEPPVRSPAQSSFQPPVGMMPGQAMLPVQSDESLLEQDSKQREQQAVAGLTDARNAWQQGDEEAAVARYTELMEQYPNHPDFAGELGNIYFSKGQHRQAVDAYSEAFARLIRNNDYERAWQLLNVIRRMDYQRASQLERFFAR